MRAKLVHLTDRQFEHLNRVAGEIGISVSEFIRRILDHHIEAGLPDPSAPEKERIPKRMRPDG